MSLTSASARRVASHSAAAPPSGVSATSFSPGASRPVLRGFQGERVRVLTDGLGSLDVSNTSTDHGVTIDPLTAERKFEDVVKSAQDAAVLVLVY